MKNLRLFAEGLFDIIITRGLADAEDGIRVTHETGPDAVSYLKIKKKGSRSLFKGRIISLQCEVRAILAFLRGCIDDMPRARHGPTCGALGHLRLSVCRFDFGFKSATQIAITHKRDSKRPE